MADTNETIADIIGKIRAEADYIEETARGSLKAGENYDGIAYTESDLESALDLAETKRKEADRLEAAHKRERGDCAKLREALEAAVERLIRIVGCDHYKFCRDEHHCEFKTTIGECGKKRICETIFKAQDALAAPPRNCDKYSHDEALNIWAAENENERNGCFDEWLYHEATEQEGATDGE